MLGGSKNMGFGYDVTYGGLSAKFVKEDRSIQVIGSTNYETKIKGTDKSEFDLLLDARLRMKAFQSDSFRVDRFCGFGFQMNDTHTTNVSQTNIWLEFGVAPELFITDSLSVEIPLGFRLLMVGETGSGVDNGFTRFGTFGSGATLAGVSFNYYFGK
ncbi:MAG: hypothetical protein A3J83_06050 [Elusimicrobia bacterium RIFOXYA2_FULL_40_6]|nr:MAG: hypothetical protein A3J83_06050 [Elusimicrobia bacterium RIFOXYA2_FULL_40_6]